ncbi:MAG: glutaminase A, partial [Cetobacterium sp.]
MQKLLNDLIEKHRKITEQGKVASYIPELEKSNPHDLGIYVLDNNGNEYFAGDYNVKFTVQSISKVVALMLAILDNGEEYVFSKVGMDPSGDPFNSIRKLETSSRRKPYNPMINAGAIVVSSMIKGDDAKHKFNRLLEFFKKITEDSTLELNPKVYLSEAETGNKNRAMGYYLKAEGIITGNVEDALEIYFKQCSIDVTAKTIAKLGLFLANEGKLSSGEQVVSERVSRIVKTLMVTCGMYDSSGEFAVRVGLPSKSGVGGGIVSVVPHKMGIGVYSPALDQKGNP